MPKRLIASPVRALSIAFLVAACGSQSGSAQGGDGTVAAPAPAPPQVTPEAQEVPADAAVPCKDGITETCTAWNERATCFVRSDGTREWRKEACKDGCSAGKCSASACVDECALGETAGGRTCRLWSMKDQAFVDAAPETSLHDRARDYDRRLRTTNLVGGQVVNVNYTDAARATVSVYSGYRDAAIWTGSALAAQAWRLAATRSPDAERQLQAFVKTLHDDFEITGAPGYPARFILPAGSNIGLRHPKTCGQEDWTCGGARDWVGGTSRDQYTGVMLGYLAAYLATSDAATKAIIRKDVVSVARELMTKRSVPIRVSIGQATMDKTVELENVILVPAEMKDGRVLVDLSTSDPAESGMSGMREFFPDFSALVKPVLGIGQPIPRDSSAVMIGAFFEMALLMAKEDPAMAKDFQELDTYYAKNVARWLDIAKGWSFSTRDGCGRGYFATHIAYIMAYAWASIATNPGIAESIRDDVLGQRLWSAVSGHKNPYFAFMWGGTRPATPDQTVIGSALGQLGQFEPGPRVRLARDVRGASQYLPHDPACPDSTDVKTNATDVKDRRVDDFLWQRQPWLLFDPGEPTIVFPGVDYTAAYWIARRHGFVSDDREGTCARFE